MAELYQNKDDTQREVDQFLIREIDTVPHLEALLLLWNSRPKRWNVVQMAHGLFLDADTARAILLDLQRRALIVGEGDEIFGCDPDPDKDRLLAAVDAAYRTELIRISRLIHSKASASIREFARAFRFKKERE